jgi:chorismate synthase
MGGASDLPPSLVIKRAYGRHHTWALPQTVPMVEAMVALVLVDHYLRQRAIAGSALP